MIRNPEVRKELIVYAVITLVAAVAASFFSPVSSVLVIILGAALTAAHFFFSRQRYNKIAELSNSLNRILLGQQSVLINEMNEGELSILYSEIHKMTMRLKEQADLLLADKRGLTTAIEDIFHQLRTPMTAMNLTISLLADENLTYEKRIRLTHDLKRQTEKMSWLVDSLLKMSKIDSQSAVFQTEQVSVKELIGKASSPFLVQMELKDIAFKTDIHDERFVGDMLWSTEAFGNLIKNAVEHTTPGGTICVTANETALFTEITVSDNGEGFTQEDIPHLFERFYKGKNATQGSIGIGLALSRAIITAQDGTIAAKNNADGGAEFVVKFYKTVV